MRKTRRQYKLVQHKMLIVTGALILLAVMISATKPQISSAAPGDLSSIVAKYPILSGSSLQTCDLCHTASVPNLNSFGAAYKAAGRNNAAFGAIENLDSDGDGFTNIQEINALTFPGNSASHPAVPTATKVPAPTNTSVPNPTSIPTNQPNSAFVTTELTPSSVDVGNSSSASVNLNNVPAGGFASAEITCTYNPALIEVSNVAFTSLFGADPATVINDSQAGSFIAAIAGSKGSKALTSGPVFTFSAKGLQAGQASIDCQTRVSTGNLTLAAIPSTPASLSIGSMTTQGTLSGQVMAGKPVTITLYDSGNSVAGSVNANADGTFSLQSSAGVFTAIVSAPGYLRAQGSASITSGNTTTLPTISLLAGDIDGNDVIDQFDALTIGINYNGTTPAAADLNNDGVINVLDLEVLALNYRQTGPHVWQ